MTSDDDEWETSKAAMASIAPVLDAIQETVNSAGPVDLMQAYFICLRAIKEVDMDKTRLERFVAVLMADRTYQAVGEL